MTAIAAVGAGRMGRGIAQVFAYAGHAVALIDLKDRPATDRDALFADALAEVRDNLDFLAGEGLFDPAMVDGILARIACVGPDGAPAALAAAEVIFEGVPEVLQAKAGALAAIGAHARPGATVASTTSTILVDTLAGHVPGPDRFLNAHWLNPAFLIPLVEVSPGTATDPAVTDSLIALLEAVGKVPVRCRPVPGFIVPRLQVVAMNEAARMVEEGVATAEDIDRAVRYGFGPRYAAMGLLEFIDWGGGDILYYASNYLTEALESDRYRAPEVIARHMRDGRQGLRDGRGFYDYADRDMAAYRRETLSRFTGLMRHMRLLRPPHPSGKDE